MKPVVTIDGPSGAGKGTVARVVAGRLGFSLLDSGSLYRLTGLASLLRGIDLSSEESTAEVAQSLAVEFVIKNDQLCILLDGEDVTQTIREENIGMAASAVASHNLVREALLERQRGFSTENGLVADGRDMGTEVFPSAQCKIFLTASAEERARRRVEQLRLSGVKSIEFQKILADIELRDRQDSTRKVSPLKPAPDAIMLDSTELSIEEVCEQVLRAVNKALL